MYNVLLMCDDVPPMYLKLLVTLQIYIYPKWMQWSRVSKAALRLSRMSREWSSEEEVTLMSVLSVL